jgi:gamma-glutamyltranspeptidase/glutathione hydrolase
VLRPPAYAARAMAATSQPSATLAALRMLDQGGNAVDAAIAAAAVLSVTEPMSTGLGGDAFAIVWHDGEVSALDAAGPAPANADPEAPVEAVGPRSVTVPGAVAGWRALSERFGRLGLDTCLAPAIDLARGGFALGARAASIWSGAPPEYPQRPRAGDVIRLPELAASLAALDGFYEGAIADAIVAASWLEHEDLARYEPRWVEPLRLHYRGVEVLELPPPTQGVAALEALALHARDLDLVTAVRLALDDALARVRDGADVSDLLGDAHLDERLRTAPPPVAEPAGGTVYLCVVDSDRMAVSFIQSIFASFGAQICAPGTGIVLQNRGACFSVAGRVTPGARPYHTIIPGMLLRDGALLGPFGIMGGFIQAQAHAQFVSAVVDDGLDPQAALDRPRFRVEGEHVAREEGFDIGFGGGQAIFVHGEGLVGGSDNRKDGIAAG